MALNAFLTLKGKLQGDIKGSSTLKGREGKIIVIAANHEVLSPKDVTTGLPSGKHMHRPFVITKEVDKSTPLLYNMLIKNEIAITWILQFYQANAQGLEKQYYTVQLTNATITDIAFKMDNNKHADLMQYAAYEEVSFVYQKIEWLYVDGGIEAVDDIIVTI
jgi:type VI secretion system secreted protein Hcp